MNRVCLTFGCLCAVVASAGLLLGDEYPRMSPDPVRVESGQLRIGLEPARGSLREVIHVADGDNRLADREEAFSVWEVVAVAGETTVTLAPTQVEPPQIERISEEKPGLRLTWQEIPLADGRPLRVVAEVRVDDQGSRWTLNIRKPEDMRLKEIRFPRVAALKPREHEVLAVPVSMGRILSEPRTVLFDAPNRNHRLSWHYPSPLSMQCMVYYEPAGPGLYMACDDPLAYSKMFAIWGDPQKQVHMEVVHTPEQEAVDVAEFRLPYPIVLNTFRGDWSTAAERYRDLPVARAVAEGGRLRRNLVPEWVKQTGLWVWNRGRSEDVLLPAVQLQKHVQAPVSVLWHWWHDCAYDAAFPEYLPPREGKAAFEVALRSAQREGVHAILYMNQRLWGINTASWKQENAELYAVKGPDGKIQPEVYNTFMKTPCSPMCINTDFWRNKYAGLAQEVLCTLKADGVYMDQAGTHAACYDARHGHVIGPGRHWFQGLDALTAMIRERCLARGPVALGGEYCIEPVIPDLDMMLVLEVSNDRYVGHPWVVIPFVQAVYHPSVVTFGNFAGLVYPPYDERWPAETAPPERLTLLDRKFCKQFCLEQARTFVWGIQPMIANFRAELFRERPEEMDYLTRLVRTRQRAMKYLLDGTWLRPPSLDVPQREIDVAKIGTYTPLVASKRQYRVALAGAWRAPDGDVAVALASIDDDALSLQLPIDFQAYGLGERCTVYCIDESGRHRLERLDQANPIVRIELPPRAICLLELCRPE